MAVCIREADERLEVLDYLAAWWAARPAFTKGLLIFATTVVVIELLFRRLAPRSATYRRWTAFFEGIGHVWTAVILAIVYFVSVSAVSLFMRLFLEDPLDRKLDPEPSFWRPHEPNPLGPLAAARHQF
jgi:hypothetical protein